MFAVCRHPSAIHLALKVDSFSSILDVIGRMMTGLSLSFKFLQLFKKKRFILAHFKEDGNLDELIT